MPKVSLVCDMFFFTVRLAKVLFCSSIFCFTNTGCMKSKLMLSRNDFEAKWLDKAHQWVGKQNKRFFDKIGIAHSRQLKEMKEIKSIVGRMRAHSQEEILFDLHRLSACQEPCKVKEMQALASKVFGQRPVVVMHDVFCKDGQVSAINFRGVDYLILDVDKTRYTNYELQAIFYHEYAHFKYNDIENARRMRAVWLAYEKFVGRIGRGRMENLRISEDDFYLKYLRPYEQACELRADVYCMLKSPDNGAGHIKALLKIRNKTGNGKKCNLSTHPRIAKRLRIANDIKKKLDALFDS